jgi:hypothetical protein
MDPHTESVAEEGAALETLPTEGEDTLSFEASLEAALNTLSGATEETVDQEAVAQETVDQEAVAQETVAQEAVAQEPVAQEAVAQEPAEDAEPVENLTENVGDDWTPKAASRFKQLKSELKSSKSELDTLRQQQLEQQSKIRELTGLTENKDVEELQTKLADYEQQQMFSNLEATETYKQAISEPLRALMQQAEQIADKYDVDPDALVDVLSTNDPEKQDEQLDELLPDATDRDKAKVYRIMEDIEPIVQRRQKLYENSEAALAEAKVVEEQRETQMAAEKAKLRTNVTRNVIERVQQKLPFLAGLDNLDMGNIQKKAAESDPAVIHPVDHAYNAVSAQLLPNIVRAYMSMRKENDLLTDRLADYEGAEPTMSGQTKNVDSTSGLTSDMSFEESIAAALGGA